MADDKQLLPLALDGTKPAATTTPPAPPTPVKTDVAPARSDAPTTDADPIESWIREHPEETRDASTVPEPPVETVKSDTTPATTTTTTVKTEPQPQPDPNAQTQPQTPAPPQTYDANEKFAIAEGVEWTRSQIEMGLRERVGAIQEADAFREILGMTAAQAREQVAPLFQRLRQDQNATAFLDSYLSDPERAKYLNECSKFYDEEHPKTAPAEQQPPQPQRVDDPRVTELLTWKQTQERTAAATRAQSELAQAQQRYPILGTDARWMRRLLLDASALAAADPSKGILDALDALAPDLEAITIARNAQNVTPAAPAAAPVPALLASPGASPTSRSELPPPNPNVDPVDDWLNVAPKLGFAQ